MTRRATFIRAANRRVLGINRRNVEFVQPRNARTDFPLANDKLRTKEVLSSAGIPAAPTLATFDSFFDLRYLDERIGSLDELVIKPARSGGGRGILVIESRRGGRFFAAGGREVSREQIRRHLADIVFGVYSFDRSDVALIEPRLRPHPFFARFYADGLSDIRLILVDERPALGMIRVPTHGSMGRANLHQGALGLGVDLEGGAIHRAWYRNRPVRAHPDSGTALTGRVPAWSAILDMSLAVARAVPLKYLGVDIVVDAERGPLVLEINVRPGLEIQNVTGVGLRDRFRAMGIAT